MCLVGHSAHVGRDLVVSLSMAPAALPGVMTVVAAWMLDPASFQPALFSARQAAMSIRPSGNGPRMSRPMHAFRNQLIAAAHGHQ